MAEKGRRRVASEIDAEVVSGRQEPQQIEEAIMVTDLEDGPACGFFLRVEMDGLIAFVPSHDRDRMRVILINATVPEAHGAGHHARQIPAHYPFIQFEIGDYSDDSVVEPDLILAGGHAVRFIEWEDVAVVYDDCPERGHGLRFKNGRRLGSAEPEKEEEAQDFSWVAELDGIAVDSGDVNPACLRRDPPRNLVIGRVCLSEGEIGATSVAKSGAGNNLIWEFVEGESVSPLYSQALAERVVWTLWIPADEVVIRLSRFGGTQYEDLVLRPDPDAKRLAGEALVVSILLANNPLEDIVGLKGSPGLADDRSAHFAALYKIARDPVARKVPRPVGHPGFDSGGGVTAGSTICLGATYKPTDGV